MQSSKPKGSAKPPPKVVIAIIANGFLHPAFHNFFDEDLFTVMLYNKKSAQPGSLEYPKNWTIKIDPEPETLFDVHIGFMTAANNMDDNFKKIVVCAGDMLPLYSSRELHTKLISSEKSMIRYEKVRDVYQGGLFNVYTRTQATLYELFAESGMELSTYTSEMTFQPLTTMQNQELRDDKNMNENVSLGSDNLLSVALLQRILSNPKQALFVRSVRLPLSDVKKAFQAFDGVLFSTADGGALVPEAAAASHQHKKQKVVPEPKQSKAAKEETSAEKKKKEEAKERARKKAEEAEEKAAFAAASQAWKQTNRPGKPPKKLSYTTRSSTKDHFEHQDSYHCGLHAFDHVLQERKLIFNPNEEKKYRFTIEKVDFFENDLDPMDPGIKINVSAVCNNFFPEFSLDAVKRAWASAKLILPNPKHPEWGLYYYYITGENPETSVPQKIDPGAMEAYYESFKKRFAVHAFGKEAFCDKSGNLPAGVIFEVARLLNIDTVETHQVDPLEVSTLLKPLCLGVIILMGFKAHWIAIVKYDSVLDPEEMECSIYDSLKGISKPQKIKDVFNEKNKKMFDIQTRIYLFAKETSYQSVAVKRALAFAKKVNSAPSAAAEE